MKLDCAGRTLDLSRPVVMGVVNVTPDSFSDGGRFLSRDAAVAHALRLAGEGAAILDIGGESTRPGAAPVSVEEELHRVIPVIEALSGRTAAVLSVDTSKPEVMRAAAVAGVGLINDVRALREPGALEAATATSCAVCLMHMQGEPRTMQQAPVYENILSEVDTYFAQQIARCEAAGIKKERLILDPGFGFGKNLSHNYELLAHLGDFHHFGLPLLVGMSRKSMIGQLLNVGPSQRLTGSLSCAVIAAMQGAQIIRAHDVKETAEAMRVVEATRRAKGVS